MLEKFFWGRNRKDGIPFGGADEGSTPGASERKIFQGHCYLQYFSAGALRAWGVFWGQILPEGFEPNAKGFLRGSQDRKKFSSILTENQSMRNPMNCTKIYFPATKVF